MKYKIYRQFTEKIWKEPQTYIDMSAYLDEHQIRNMVENDVVKGQLDNLRLKVTFGPTLGGGNRIVNTQMKGIVTISDPLHPGSQKKATEVLTLLAQYMPRHLKQ